MRGVTSRTPLVPMKQCDSSLTLLPPVPHVPEESETTLKKRAVALVRSTLWKEDVTTKGKPSLSMKTPEELPGFKDHIAFYEARPADEKVSFSKSNFTHVYTVR
jgi:hypothetical protein